MAQYTVTHGCGHVVTHSLLGKIDDRVKKVERMKIELCEACLAVFNHEQYTKKNEDNAIETKELGFFKLEGTEAQVAWANSIRMEAYKSILPMVPEKNIVFFRSIICIPQEAIWWIKRKNTPPAALIEAIGKEFPCKAEPFINKMKENT